MPPPDGLEILRQLATEADPPAVIVTTGVTTIDVAVEAMRLGAFAYLAKPYRMAELDMLVDRALEHRALGLENRALRERVARAEGADGFLTNYAPLRAVLALATEAAASDAPVLIAGEPGSGKCALARVIHANSGCAHQRFAAISGAGLAGPLAAASLFGMRSSTDPAAERGALAAAGTLYLEDVFAIPRAVQTRFAKALDVGRYRPNGGGTEDTAIRARIVAGTRSLPGDADGAQPVLRAALDVAVVSLPPLRERAVDIPLLANAFLRGAGDALPHRVEPDALAMLQRYTWPGNVAELRAVIDRARLIARDGVIRTADLPLADADGSLQLTDVERRHIAVVLRKCGWHQGRAAAALDISPKTLYRKMRSFGLERPARRGRK
jgi:DNA-binding NtrC family response regulator